MGEGTTVSEMLELCSGNAVFLSSWENDFVADIIDKLEDNESYELSDLQVRKLNDIYEKVS